MASAVEMLEINKHFASSGVTANREVTFSADWGEVHALVGENGAGKTTLMSILYGLVEPDRGRILVDGGETSLRNPNDAIAAGIGMVHQHFKLVPSFTVAENVMLGAEPHRGGVLRRKEEVDEVRRLADRFGLGVDPTARVRDLPVGLRQRVEILKALRRDARILILDEPTAVLTPQEADDLFVVLRRLADEGRTVILITHKLVEVLEAADRVTVMRQGEVVGTTRCEDTDLSALARMMVGRDVLFRVERTPSRPGETVLEVRDLTVVGSGGVPAVLDVSFEVKAGEVLGIAGVAGNGQTELVEAIAGIRRVDEGRILLGGRELSHSTVQRRRRAGMAHIPEDRMVVGVNLDASIDENLAVSRYRASPFSRFGFLVRKELRDFTERVIGDFRVASARPGGSISTLSGGNLQKIVLGRELSGWNGAGGGARRGSMSGKGGTGDEEGGESRVMRAEKAAPRLIIANQPTRGLDVGSIEFVHRTLLEARDAGAAILLVSVELDEILALSDRIAVLFRGSIAGELSPEDATEERLGILMAGGGDTAGLHPFPMGGTET